MRRLVHPVLAVLVLFLAACDDDPSGLPRADVAGSYQLTALTFDPQGSLPEVDLLPRIGGVPPRLILATTGRLQLVFENPQTSLLTIVPGTFVTPPTAVRIEFGANTSYRTLFLSSRMTFAAGADGKLTYSGNAPDGVARDRLVQLVPEFAGEQLLDPVPGTLRVEFTRIEQGAQALSR